MKLTIIIPCYNEEKRLPATLKKISSYLQKKKMIADLLVVDDGSTDKTATVAKNWARVLSLRKNCGKGAAVRAGVLAAKSDWILFTDADLSTPIEELSAFLILAPSYDLLIASRNMKESKIEIKQPFMRSILGKGFAKLVPFILGLNIKDTQCGFKLMRTTYAKRIMRTLKTTGWAFDAEILFRAQQKKLRILELPVRWKNSEMSKVNSITAPLQMLTDVVKIRIRGFYEK